MGPVVGITCATDAGDVSPLLSGRIINYVDTAYVAAIEAAEAVPLLLPTVQDAGVCRRLLGQVDSLIVTGGGRPLPDALLALDPLPSLREQNEVRYHSDSLFIQEALSAGMPLLGVCRGHQMINEVLGGTTYRQLAPDLPEAGRHSQYPRPGDEPAHRMRVAPRTRLHTVLGEDEVEVNSFHVQAVWRVSPLCVVAARSDDGVIEAIESQVHPFVVGVQYHPERMPEAAHSRKLFRALAAAALSFVAQRQGACGVLATAAPTGRLHRRRLRALDLQRQWAD